MQNNRNDTKLHIIILISDLIANLMGVAVAFLIRYHLIFGTSKNFDQVWLAILILIVIGILDIIISPIGQFSTRGVFAELVDVVKHQVLGIAMVIIILYLVHSAAALSRLVFVYYLLIGILIVWAIRLVVKKYLLKVYKNGSHAIRLLIVSDSDNIDQVEARVLQANDWNTLIDKAIAVDEYGFDNLLEYATHNAIDEALIYIPNAQEDATYKLLISNMVSMGIRVNIGIPQLEVDIAGNRSIAEVGPFTTLSICRNSLTIGQQAVKRFFDIIGGIVGTIICAIAFIIVGPIIKLDSSGPIIFKQDRVGKNGRIFDFYKFRSMYVDAEQRKKELSDKNEISGLMFKIEDDPRITKVGKFIRKTSIDELPQFWNVLKGDMSLVGTRPPTVDEYQRYQPWHKSRLSMKPGITGMWQVSGRSDIKDFDQVVALDVQYIDNWSVLTDIKILLKTIEVVITGKGSK